MGDGGIACVSLPPIMEKFPSSESFCGSGNSNSNSNSNGKVEGTTSKTTTVKRATTKRMKLKRDAFFKKEEPEKKSAAAAAEKAKEKENAEMEEVEEGELGTLKSPKMEVETGEVMPEKSLKAEVERGEIVGHKGRKEEVEKGEIVSEKWRKEGPERHEFSGSGRLRSDVIVKRERTPEQKWRDEVEKGEFIPERWHHKGETFRDEYPGYAKGRRVDPSRDREHRYEPDWTLPSVRYSGEDISPGREVSSRSGNRHSKRAGRWDGNQERSYSKMSSKVMDDVGSYKNEYSHGRSHGREHSSNNRLKRQGTDSDSSDRKVYDDQGDYVSSKSRRLSGEGCRSVHSEHYSRQSAEKSFRNSNSSRAAVSDRLSVRHYDSPSARGGYERYRRSPSYSERSPPRERARYYDHRDRTPARYERSPGYQDHRDRSPVRHERSPPGYHDHRDRTPSRHERSPPGYHDQRDRTPARHERSPPGYHDQRDRTPARHERSPPGYRDQRDRTPAQHERSPPGYRDHRRDTRRSPNYSERSPHDRGKVYDRRDRSPSFLERSPHDRSSRPNNHRPTSKKSEVSEIKQNDKAQEDKPTDKNTSDKESISSAKGVENEKPSQNGTVETKISHDISAAAHGCQSPKEVGVEQPSIANGFVEELPDMEEDMDICDTPPHVPAVVNVNPGKWYYIDHHGEERGPSRLCNLKGLVEEGYLMSDHLIKHADSDRWVTVENAASPVATAGYSTIFSDSVTQLVSPPEAPGNMLADVRDTDQSGSQVCTVDSGDLSKDVGRLDEQVPLEDLSIDDRVGALLEGFTLIPGKELEVVGEVLQVTFDQSEWERFGSIKGIFHVHPCSDEPSELNHEEDFQRNQDAVAKESTESTSTSGFDKEYGFPSNEFTEWFSGRWTCKGGDWQRNDEAVHERFLRKKVVLNDGYPLCQMPKSGYEDPRWQRKDDLYFPCQSRKLDLPPCAICWPDEKNESNVVTKAGLTKHAIRGVKGTTMPVIRINACVVKDPGTFSESRSKQKVKDKHSSKSAKLYSSSSDMKNISGEDTSVSKSLIEQSSVIKKPMDRVCTVDDLQLNIGYWFYLDGAGHERGPFSCSALLSLVEEGCLKMQSSVFRKIDRIWVPISSVIKVSEDGVKFVKEGIMPAGESSNATACPDLKSVASNSLHKLHPQFIGYTLGKLHELVMKSYRSREFAAAINEVLDPWINSRQPKKETEKQLYYKPMNKGSLYKWPLDGELSVQNGDDVQARKRCRVLTGVVQEGYEMSEIVQPLCYSDPSFEDLCGDVTFSGEEIEHSETPFGSWGLLDGHILARIFHFLRADVKSLVLAALTCKHWRAAVGFYKNVCIRVDFSTFASNCSDSVIASVMNGFNKQMIKSLVLDGCTNISSSVLEEILKAFSCISSVDIRGCSQFEDLVIRFPHVIWVKERKMVEESNLRSRILKQMADQHLSVSKSGHGNYIDESSGLKDYFEMVEKRGAANQAFRRNLYKRTKISDTRKSASVLAREARLRHWAMKKAGSGHRKMEEFLVFSLKDIMKGSTSDYFVRKVADIENRVKSGYYARRGLNCAKQDIMKMCREAMKVTNRGDGGDVEHMIPLFIKLGAHLDESFKTAIDRDETSGSSGLKKYSKTGTDRKYTSRVNGSYLNCGSDYVEYSCERDSRKNVSRMNKKLDSDTESDEFELSSDDTRSDSGSVSETASDSYVRSETSTFDAKEGCFSADEAFDFVPDDREWGARMTKASIVPPVTRKYDVVDQYVIVADEEEVQRKMRVSLPDDYENKVTAQRNGSEEGDMEIPEVKEYKPRKQLGGEVIEQEVYGIDPYTHNLLLDSMPDDVDWPLVEKHVFIEDVLLRVLNKQARQYTGSGSTPMTYPLKPVIEKILETSKQELNFRYVKLSEALLQAIDKRPMDNYVGHRKGLGVVCNKEGGFTDDDFIVEFLGEVYPAWKWFEKQDGIRSLQKNSKDSAPEFYNIYLERPKGDADGYDLVVVDAMHKANYASRICHSCRPNCEAKVTAVGGQYQIGIYSVRPIGYGEEITFDYNSVTESKVEYEASVCLCGSQVCRGSYLNLTGEGAYDTVLKEWHGLLDRHRLLLEACELNWVSEEDYIDLARAGLGSCLLGDLPDWLIAYSARLVRFINFERSKLPDEILRHNMDEKKKYYAEISVEMERSDAEVQAEGVFGQRLQNLALTLDKVRYVLRCVFGDPKKAPPPLQKLCPEEVVCALWSGEGSLVDELLQSVAPHVDTRLLQDLKLKIRAHDPSMSGNIEKELQKSLLWLRDEVRDLDCTYKCRHDAAADLIHIYAYTKCFFKIREYKTVTSPPVYISPLDLGPKCGNKLSGVTEYCKTYGENYCLGQLVFWYNQTKADPDRVLVRKSRGCLSLPEVGSFYAKIQKPSRHRVYGSGTVRYMLARMEKKPQSPWPTKRIWSFKTDLKIFGSPVLDAVLNNSQLEREMVSWLKNRPAIFQAKWDM